MECRHIVGLIEDSDRIVFVDEFEVNRALVDEFLCCPFCGENVQEILEGI